MGYSLRENPKSGTTTRYVYGIGLLYEVDDNDTPTYYHYDQSGSTIALTDASGAVTDRYEYSPFGTITHRKGTTDTPYLYVGQLGIQTDANGLLHMRARYYNPLVRRFINADPTGFDGGLNWYQYANNSPLLYVDPDGEHPVLALLAIAAISGGSSTAIGWGVAAATGQGYSLANAATDFGIGAGIGVLTGGTGAMIRNGSQISRSLARSSTAFARVRKWWRTGIENDKAWRSLSIKNKLYYEIGQKTLNSSRHFSPYANLSAVGRGRQLVGRQGLVRAFLPQRSGLKLGFGSTFGTGPTPLVRYAVPRAAATGAYGTSAYLGSQHSSWSRGRK